MIWVQNTVGVKRWHIVSPGGPPRRTEYDVDKSGHVWTLCHQGFPDGTATEVLSGAECLRCRRVSDARRLRLADYLLTT